MTTSSIISTATQWCVSMATQKPKMNTFHVRSGLQSLQWRHMASQINHDDVIKWKHFPRYWPFVRGIHRSPVNSPHKGQWRGALIFSLICARINGWVNSRYAGDLRHHWAHYDVIVMNGCLCNSWPGQQRKYKSCALLTLCEGSPLVTDGFSSPYNAKNASVPSRVHDKSTLIARSMGPTWNHLGPTGSRSAPCWPQELCYLGTD